jgi:hypothetical protein
MPRNEPKSPLDGPRLWRDLRRLGFWAQFSQFLAMARRQYGGA